MSLNRINLFAQNTIEENRLLSELHSSKIFLYGLIIRLIFIIFCFPLTQKIRFLDFINNYQEKFSMVPHEKSFLGYDLLNSMINAVYPVEFDNSLEYVGHYNNSDFQQIGINNGFENKVVKLFEYSDFTLKELK